MLEVGVGLDPVVAEVVDVPVAVAEQEAEGDGRVDVRATVVQGVELLGAACAVDADPEEVLGAVGAVQQGGLVR
ncbi:hypothetical protein PUR61_25345, partial [Streptomyces sp. BE20]|uniref:hypothetical protein n=1 Tax=Streptomyces sp. BE20 TaxID=3002525 RepID=UPI002E7A1E19